MLIVRIFRTLLFIVSAIFIAHTTSTVSDDVRQSLLYFAMFATVAPVIGLFLHVGAFLGMIELLVELAACLWGFGILQYIDGLDQSNLECKGATLNFSLTQCNNPWLEQLIKLFAMFNIAFSAFIIGGSGALIGGLVSSVAKKQFKSLN